MSRREHLFWLSVHGGVMVLCFFAFAKDGFSRNWTDFDTALLLLNAMFALAHASRLVAGERR